MSHRILVSLVAVLLLALVLVAAHRWAPGGSASAINMLAPVECNPHRSICVFDWLGRGPVSLAFSPRPIRAAGSLTVDVHLNGPVDRVSIAFSGTQMEMGLNAAELKALEPSHYRVVTSLPVCTTGRMEWQAVLTIVQEGRATGMPFRFFVPE